MGRPFPTLDQSERIELAYKLLTLANAAIVVTDAGEPIGVVTRQDIISYLSVISPTLGTARMKFSQPASTPDKRPTATARRSFRSTRPQPTRKMRSACTKASITVARSTDARRAGKTTRLTRKTRRSAARSPAHGRRRLRSTCSLPAIRRRHEDLYGGTYRLFSRVLSRYGLDFTYVDMRDLAAVKAAIRPNTRMIWIETPTNRCSPRRHRGDRALRSGTAHRRRRRQHFASPYFQQPLALGADVVVHSTTKYIGGHSDVVGGAVLTTMPASTTR